MRPQTVVYIGTSLDGFISREDGSVDWLAPAEDPQAFQRFDDFLSSIEAIVMGRNTFALALGFGHWPYHKIPVHVLSRSLTELPAATPPTVHLTKSSPEDLLDELGSRSVKRVYIDGGITIQNFLARDLIDELTIARVPVLLGNGRTFFGAVPEDLLFQHVSTDVFATGTVQSKYIRKRQ